MYGAILLPGLFWATIVWGSSLTVQGNITDSDGEALIDILVEVWDDDTWPIDDDLMGSTHTDANGHYSIFFSDPSIWWDGGPDYEPDIYIRVHWKFRLIPESAFN